LLGAVKTSSGWVYEIVDGDKTSDNRTTGDVAFTIAATSYNNTVYIIYDSVLKINATGSATSTEVRLATRKTIFPEDWRHQTLDESEKRIALAGFRVAIKLIGEEIYGTWLEADSSANSGPNLIKVSRLDVFADVAQYETWFFGTPNSLAFSKGREIVFQCLGRLCRSESSKSTPILLHGSTAFGQTISTLRIKKSHYALVSLRKLLSIIRVD
jgi:hypothetical protein